MSSSIPEIAAVRALAGAAPGRPAPPLALLAPPAGICRVGLVLSDGRTAWGDCVAAPRVNPMLPDSPFLANEAVNTVQTVVAPALVGQSLDDFMRLVGLVDVLTETKTISKSVTPPPGKSPPRQLTRRELLTGRFNQPAPAKPRTVSVPVEQLIHPAIRYGVSQALLNALALARGQSPAVFLAGLAGQTLPLAALPLLGESHGEPDLTARLVNLRVAALGYRAPGVDPLLELGSRLEEWLAHVVGSTRGEFWDEGTPYRPAIYLAVNGGLGQLHGNRPDKVADRLAELAASCGDHALIVETPLLTGRLPGQIDLLAGLQEICRRRGLAVEIAAATWLNGLSDLEAFLTAGAVDRVTLLPARFGGLQQTMAALRRCQAAGVPALLLGAPGETPQSAGLLTALALVYRPALLAGMPDLGGANGVILARNEMDGLAAESAAVAAMARPYQESE